VSAFFRSERHAMLAEAHPSEPAPWQKPSPRQRLCTCGAFEGEPRPCPTADACGLPEVAPSRFDAEGRRQVRWLVGGIVLAVVVVVGLLSGVFA
jgi:hypothetical protein